MLNGKRVSRAFWMLVVSCLCLGSLALGQSQVAGGMGGVVTDAQHKLLVGAVVTATNVNTGVTAAGKTDGSGRFIISNLVPGSYDVQIANTGFSNYQQKSVQVEVGLVTNVDAVMVVGSQAQTVEVSGEAPVVQTEQSAFTTDLNQAALQDLPINQRRWSNFTLTTPGAVADGTFGDISYRGVPYMFDNNTVDGSSNTESFFAEEVGRTRMDYSTSLLSVAEFQVATSNYSAEYGRAVGGVVNAVTKSGTNEIHGDLLYFNRDNTIGGAYTPFATGAVQTSPGVFATVPIKPLDIRQQMAADAGGPFAKNKFFWYVDWDGVIRHFPLTNIPTTPGNFFLPITVAAPASCAGAQSFGSLATKTLTTGQVLECRGYTQAEVNSALTTIDGTTGTSPRTGDQTIFFPKLDWHPNGSNTVTASYNRVRWYSPFGVQTANVTPRSVDSNGNDYVHDDRLVGEWNSVVSPTMGNDMRFVYSRDFEFEFTTAPGAGEPTSALTGLSPQADINGCGFNNTGSAQACGWTIGAPYYLERPQYPNERRLEAADTVSIMAGKHFLKFGVNSSVPNDNLVSYAAGDELGEYSYTYLQDYLSDYMSAVNHQAFGCMTTNAANNVPIPCYTDYLQTFGPLGFQFHTVQTGMFAQDDWHVTSRLTLNAGLRWDHEGLPPAIVPNPAIPQTVAFPNEHKDYGPRIGFAYDLNGDGKTVVRGGYGYYVGVISNEQVYEELSLTGSAQSQIAATIFPTAGSSDSGAVTVGAPSYPNTLASYNASVGTPNIAYFPSDMRLPGAEEYDLVAEREIMPNTAVSVSLIGSVGRFLPVGLDTNLPTSQGDIAYTVSGGPNAGATVNVPFFGGTRPNPNYTKMVMFCTCGISHYNALVLQFNRRLRNGIQFNINYTDASATTDAGSGDSPAITGNGPLDPQNLSLDEGTSPLEVRNRFIGQLVWTPNPVKGSNGVLAMVANGWVLSINDVAQSGFRYTAGVSGSLPSGTFTLTNGTQLKAIPNSGGGITGGGTLARAPFTAIDGYAAPGQYNTDARLARNVSFSERIKGEFTFEAFNLMNHFNTTAVTTSAYSLGGTVAAPTLTYSPSFGAPTAANNAFFLGPRQLQFGAKISF